jgi:glucose-1-phosphate cytidylyltransferase
MKVVILAGGYGSRLSEETDQIPKPMVQIGGWPILWHIMKIYGHHGLTDFIICLGYKGYVIKEYFNNYFLHNSDVTLNLKDNRMEVHQNRTEDWRITLVDTGQDTMTGGRLKRVAPYIGQETFCFTYGDGVGDINIRKLLEFHKSHGKLATVTAVAPTGRFGILETQADMVSGFHEKIESETTLINGGFFVLEHGVFDYIAGDSTIWEREPMVRLAQDRQLVSFHHTGFWQPMDTLREKRKLEELWQSNNARWKVWD